MGETFGAYSVHEEIGVGGMARVHRAERTGIEGFSKVVALKRMLPHVAMNEELVKSFVREARLASHLRHANVAQTYELGKVDGIYFIAMELVVGHELGEITKRCSPSKPMPVGVVVNIVAQICDALDYAHNLTDDTGQPLGIIHRDVSPSNIIIAEGGVVKLIDFGIAKARAGDMQTMSFSVKGKFGYMAPEYLAGSIDARADLFALGVIAYELLTNAPLFTGAEDLDTLNKLRTMAIDPPSQRNPRVPAELDAVVMTALSRDPDTRWQQAGAMRDAIAQTVRRTGLAVTNATVAQWIAELFGGGRTAFEDNQSTTVDSLEPTLTAPAIASPLYGVEITATTRAMQAPPLPASGVPDSWETDNTNAQTQVRRSGPIAVPTMTTPNRNSGAIRIPTPAPGTLMMAAPPPGAVAAPHAYTDSGPVPVAIPNVASGPMPTAHRADSGPAPMYYAHVDSGPVQMPYARADSGPIQQYAQVDSGPVPVPYAQPHRFETAPVERSGASRWLLLLLLFGGAGALAAALTYLLLG